MTSTLRYYALSFPRRLVWAWCMERERETGAYRC